MGKFLRYWLFTSMLFATSVTATANKEPIDLGIYVFVGQPTPAVSYYLGYLNIGTTYNRSGRGHNGRNPNQIKKKRNNPGNKHMAAGCDADGEINFAHAQSDVAYNVLTGNRPRRNSSVSNGGIRDLAVSWTNFALH